MKLKVTFELNGLSKVTEVEELHQVKGGFWIDKSDNFCLSHEAEIYVLPHMIRHVIKEHVEKYQDESQQEVTL